MGIWAAAKSALLPEIAERRLGISLYWQLVGPALHDPGGNPEAIQQP